MKFKALALAFLMATGVAQAETIKQNIVGIHTISRHHDSGFVENGVEKKYNEVNPGVYFMHSSGATFGAYRNSYYKNALYAGWTFNVANLGDFKLDVSTILVTGYQGYSSSSYLKPAILPSIVSPEFHGVRFRVIAIPNVGETAGFFHLMIEKRF